MVSLEKLFRKINHFDSNLNKWGLFIGCIFLVLILGSADYLSGFEFSLSLFYLVPVSIAAWHINRNGALFMAAFSAMTWFISNDLAGQTFTHPAIGYWNTSVRLGFFGITALLLVDLKRFTQRERDQSRLDYLTGITNSRAFRELASLELLRAKRYEHPFSLAFIDLDNFKHINDRYGHLVGDEVLKVVATTIQSNIRQTDIVARLGGDEFVVFLPESDAISATIAINKLRSILLNSMNENNWQISFSIGVITFPDCCVSLDEVIRKADELMYSVKDNGKNNIKFSVEPAP
jgi:diguanylate cyclase (GGDEF)-like protein